MKISSTVGPGSKPADLRSRISFYERIVASARCISSLHGWRIWPLFAFFRFLLLSSKEFHMSRSVSRPSFTFEILLCNGSNALVSVTVSHRPHVVLFTSTIAATH